MEIKICPYCEGTGVSNRKEYRGINNDSCVKCLGYGRMKLVSFQYMMPFSVDNYEICKKEDMMESIIDREFSSL